MIDLTKCSRCGRDIRYEKKEIDGVQGMEIFIDEHIEKYHAEEYRKFKVEYLREKYPGDP